MIGEDVTKTLLGKEGRLFGEIKSECRCKEDWHIKHCGKQNVLLLNCVTGEAVKPKISCEENRGMQSDLSSWLKHSELSQKSFNLSAVLKLFSPLTPEVALPGVILYGLSWFVVCCRKWNFIFHYVCNERVVCSSHCLYGCMKIKRIKRLLCTYKWQNSNIRQILKIAMSKSLFTLNVQLLVSLTWSFKFINSGEKILCYLFVWIPVL